MWGQDQRWKCYKWSKEDALKTLIAVWLYLGIKGSRPTRSVFIATTSVWNDAVNAVLVVTNDAAASYDSR